jgi:hypothetical protein
MTVMAERPAKAANAKDPRELVDPEVFDKLVGYVMEHESVTRPYAEGMIGQTLVFLKAVADNPRVRLAMDETVDPGWHAFILHSVEYTEFCDRLAGRYLHHVPPPPGVAMDDDAVARTLPALRATGYRVEEEFWVNRSPCCPPNPCIAG